MLGAICGSAISMDLLAQSMDPYSAQKSMDVCAICGFCAGCKSFHYSNPSLAQTYILTDWQPPLTTTIDRTE